MDVLICDDHVVFADSLAELLIARGVNVVAVTYHPNEALRVLKRVHVDVSVLDVSYGCQTVFGYLPSLRTAAPVCEFVLLTGHLDDEVVQAGREAGVLGFCEKRQATNVIMGVMERAAAHRSVIPRPRCNSSAALAGWTAEEHARHLASFLTPRERRVLSELVGGADTLRIARSLGIRQATARSHIQSVLIKLNVHSRVEAATSAVRFGLIHPVTGEWLAG